MAWVGNPSSNSSVPIRVPTRSGVMILAGIGGLKPSGVTVSLIGLLSPFSASLSVELAQPTKPTVRSETM